MTAEQGSKGAFLPFLAAGSLLLLASAIGVHYGRQSVEQKAPLVETVLRPSPSVVVAVRELARLEGAVYSIERVVDLKEKQSRFFQLVQAEDAILLVASGEVTAGVDLAALAEGSVRIDPSRKKVSLTLPRATVFSRRLDNERTYVHTRKTDVWAKRQEDLESKARQEAERTLEEAAVRSGILPQAEKSVARTVESLLHSLGFTVVDVRFIDAEGEALPAEHEQ